MRLPLVLCGLLLFALPAEARMHAPYRGHRIVQTSQAPLDGFTQPTTAYGFRLLRKAYLGTGAAVRLRRVLDSVESDIGFDGSGNFDTATATAHCAGTTCTVATWYDQSGHGRIANRAAAGQPAYVANCVGALPCLRGTSSAHILGSPDTAASVMPVSLSAVAIRSVGTGQCFWADEFVPNNYLSTAPASANNWVLVGGSGGSVTAAATDNAWHAASGVINGASSVLRIDGVETTGTTTGATAANYSVPFQGADGTTCSLAESIQWDAYALTAGDRAVLQANQKAYWGTP